MHPIFVNRREFILGFCLFMRFFDNKKNIQFILEQINVQHTHFKVDLKVQVASKPPPHNHLQVSVGSRYSPYLYSFQRAFLPHSNADIFVPVGAVTLGLGWAMGTTGTA